MPCFTNNIVNNQIIFACQVTKSHPSEVTSLSDFSKHPSLRALLDTGAQQTCITEDVATGLNTSPVSWGNLSGVGGQQQCEQYLVDLYISVSEIIGSPLSDGSSQEMAVFGRGFGETKVSVLPGSTDKWGFDVLLGMDIIMLCHLTLHSRGAFTLCI